MKVLKVRTVYQIASDFERAVAFYSDLFGMTVKFRDGDRWCQFDTGGAGFAISSSDEAATGSRGTVAVLEVDDLDEARRVLEGRGVKLAATRDMGAHGRVLTCRDPDGNTIQLFQPAPKAGGNAPGGSAE